MIKISNIKSIVTWDVDQKKVIHIDNQSIYLKDKKIFKITDQDLPCEHKIDAENAIITPDLLIAILTQFLLVVGLMNLI